MMNVSLNLKSKKFSGLIDAGEVTVDDFGLKYHGVQSMFSTINPLVRTMVNDAKAVKVFFEMGRWLKSYYSGLSLDEFFNRLAYQGFGIFEYFLEDDNLIISGKSNFCSECWSEFKKPVKVNVDSILLGLFSEIGVKVFKKAKVVKKSCIALGDTSCSFKIIKV